MLRRTAHRILVRLGHQVLEAGGGREALEILDAGETIDLVISDVAMPDMDGVELHRALQRRGSPPPFLFTSGYSIEETMNRRRMPDGAVYLPKPWTMDELRAPLSEVREAADSA